MGNFTEIDEIKRLKDEAEQLREEIRCLIAYKVSKNTSMGDTDEEINKRRKRLVNILTTLEMVPEIRKKTRTR